MTLFRFLAIFVIASATAFVRPVAAQSVEINNAQPAATPIERDRLSGQFLCF